MSQLSTPTASNQTALFDMAHLEAVEAACRSCISSEPENMSARLRLAWCLIVRSFHEAGQEAALRQVQSVTGLPSDGAASEDTPATTAVEKASSRNRSGSTAKELLRSSLKQTMMVTQLSSNPKERNEAESLRELVALSGGKQAVLEASEESCDIFAEVTKALRQTRDDDDRALHSYTTA